MSDNGEIQVDSKVIERLKRSIIIKENMNLKTRTMNDSQMVAWIKKKIEEEVQCYLNQYNLRTSASFAMSPLILPREKASKT